jgi:DNA-binding transcriptional MerR regulator
MSKKTRLKIGEFFASKATRGRAFPFDAGNSKKLRHYEQKGLLVPDEVDEWTGYRYYCIDQMQQLKDIRDLQRLGFSLDEIKDLFDDGSHTPTLRQMTEMIRETEAQLKALIARRNQLLDWRNARKEMNTMENLAFNRCPKSSWQAIVKSSLTTPLSALCV